MPRVLDANRLTAMELLKHQWHSPDGTQKGVVLALLLGAVIMLILKKAQVLMLLSQLGFTF